jgi:hypothetical protein
VLHFASRIVSERTPMTEVLLGAASGGPYHAAQALSAEDGDTLARFGRMSGAAFDQAYVTFMANQVQHDIHVGDKPDQDMQLWKSWRYVADRMRPTLQSEERAATSLAYAVGLDGASL